MASFVERMNADTSFDGESKSVVDSKFGSVLVIYTGGTIGMKLNNDGGEVGWVIVFSVYFLSFETNAL